MLRVVAFAFAIGLVACGGGKSATLDGVYRTRAQVVEVHGSGDDLRVTVKHEAIPDFKDRSGTPSTMPAMVMAFGVGPQVDVKALTPGSLWALTFDVSWQREPVVRITEARALPADVKLDTPAE
jgi:Cu/Ag efflux protein CusF